MRLPYTSTNHEAGEAVRKDWAQDVGTDSPVYRRWTGEIMKKEDLLRLHESILGEFKKVETELDAHRMVIKGLKQAALLAPDLTLAQFAADVDETIAAARQDSFLLEKLNQKYSTALENMRQLADLAQSEEELLKLLLELPTSNWKN
jgi:hypothetical protein